MIDREEQDLNNVLSALGSAEPTLGLENRILQRLAAQPAVQARSGSRIAWWSAGFILAAASAVIGALHLPHAHPAPPPPQQAHIAQPPPLGAPPSAAPSLRMGRTTPTLTRSPQPPLEIADRGAASLPSMSAPEAPLTNQERQLLRIAHHPDKTDLALLNPQVREEIAHQSAADFERFFPKPTDQEIYLAEHANN